MLFLSYICFSNIKKKQSTSFQVLCFLSLLLSDCAGHFTGTQAAGAGVNPLRGTVNDRLYTSHVCFPGAAGTPVRVGNLHAESNFFTTNITCCHLSAPPLKGFFTKQQIYPNRFIDRMQALFPDSVPEMAEQL